MGSPRRLAVSVGALLIVAAVLAVAIVMVLGRHRFWFQKKITWRAAFPDVAGLREGSPVRLGGREVGTVVAIDFSDDPAPERALIVTFRVREALADRVRRDTVATISTRGLLGDKLLDLSVGSPHEPEIPHGGWVTAEPPADAAQLLTTATRAAEDTRDTLEAIRRVVARVDQEVVPSARRTLERIGHAADGVGRAAGEFEATARSVDRQALRDASRDLADASAGIAQIVANVEAGKGTLGGLLVDPTLYEETKRIIAGLRRNRILKALARIVISREEPAQIKDAAPDDVIVHPRRY